MRAIHWIRTRQESEELSYWLSIVFYNPKDRSLSNRMYLVYLLVFFSIWWFIALVWFANTGGMLLSLVFPMAEMQGAVGLELGILLIWFLTLLFISLRRSPVAFSEEDAYIVCQMPLSPRNLVLRWSWLPWIKSLIPFLILAMALGFSLAEVGLQSAGVVDPSIFTYVIDGVRAALVVIPLHLAAFALIWANGIWFMGHQRRKAAWILPVLTVILVSGLFVSGALASFGISLPGVIGLMGSVLPAVLMAGFGAGELGGVLLVSGIFALLSVGLMVLSAGKFSASQAAQETQTQVSNRDLKRYGFLSQVKERRVQKRLGISQRTKWQPRWTGATALIWKDLLETRRSMDISFVYKLLTFTGVGLGLVYIPNLGGRIILILTWALQASKFLTGRVREDLAHWVTSHQHPLKPLGWIMADMSLSALVMLVAVLVGMLGGAALSGQSPVGAMLSLPGMIVSIGGVSAWMMFRHSHVDLLMAGQAPGINEFGVLFATVAAAVPVVIYSVVAGWSGVVFSLIASLFIAEIALAAFQRAYHAIE